MAYTASYLSDIAMSWWQPMLSAPIKAPIWNNWLLFVQELNNLSGDVDIERTSERALKRLKMLNNHHINRYMTSFTEQASYTRWNDAALYDTFYAGLAERLKDQLLNFDHPSTLEDLKRLTLRANHRYWDRQNEQQNVTAPTSYHIAPTTVTPHSKTKNTI